MKQRITTLAILVLIGVLLVGTPVFAYFYRATYTVTSENVTDFAMLGVSTDNGVKNQWMADNGFFNSTANDTRIETLGGLEKPHMVTDNDTFTAIPVPVGSQTNLYFTTGNSELDGFYTIPGYDGYITVADDADMEFGGNFTSIISGWINTDNGSDKNLVNKDLAFQTAVSRLTDENIFSAVIGGDKDNLDFVPGNSDWVQVVDHNDFSFGDGAGNDEPFSLVAWVNFDDATTRTVIAKFGGVQQEWTLRTDAGDLLEFLCTDLAGVNYFGRETAAITGYEGSWAHIVATYDGSKTLAGFNIYIDGVDSDTADLTGGAYAGMANGTNDVTFGSTAAGVDFMDGGLAEVKVYDIELTPTQVLMDYYGEPVTTNLVGLWRMDEGAGEPLDTSGNGHDGVNNGAEWDTDFDRRFNTVTATGVSSGEHTVTTRGNAAFLGIGIDTPQADSPLAGGLALNAPMWREELDGSPFTTIDVNGHSCTVTGALWSSDGRWFDGAGAADDVITVPAGASIANLWDGGGTISFWANIASAGEASLGHFMNKNFTFIYAKDEAAGMVRLAFNVWWTGANGLWETTDLVMELNTWNMITWVYDSDNVANNPTLYLNGEAYTVGDGLTEVGVPPSLVRDDDTAHNIEIGNIGGVRTLDGYIADFWCYDVALSDAENTYLYNSTQWKYEAGDWFYTYVLLGGVGVPDNANDWILIQNNVMPYGGISGNTTFYQHILGDTLVVWYEPNDIIAGTVLPDRQGGDEPGAFTWGVNPTGVSVEMGGLVSSAQPAPGVTPDDPTPDITPGVEVTDWYIEPDVTGALLTNPLRPFVTIMSDTTTLTELQAWRILGAALWLLVTVATAGAVRGHHAITGFASGGTAMGLVAMTIYPMWVVVFAIVFIIGGLIAERTPSL